MSATTSVQIRPPKDEKKFEEQCAVLFECLLGLEGELVGRRGQKQKGIDFSINREGDPARRVGVQCKLKGIGKRLTEKEVRDEFAQALTLKHPLSEFYILTSAERDVHLQDLARDLVLEQKEQGRTIIFEIWGWGEIERKAAPHTRALREFDPEYSPFAQEQADQMSLVVSELADVKAMLAERRPLEVTSGSGVRMIAVDAHQQKVDTVLDRQIDRLRDQVRNGQPRSALASLQQLWDDEHQAASERIRFRIIANIGICLIEMGEPDRGAERLIEAYGHCPSEPKAIAIRAFAFLLQQNWDRVVEIGGENLWEGQPLSANPSGEQLASHVIQASRFRGDADPMGLIPDEFATSLAVQLVYADFLRGRGDKDWWDVARLAYELDPENETAQHFSAEALLDQALQAEAFLKTGRLSAVQQEEVKTAANRLETLWQKSLKSEAAIDETTLALCGNLATAKRALGDEWAALQTAQEGLTVSPEDQHLLLIAALAAFNSRDPALSDLLEKLDSSPGKRQIEFYANMQEELWPQLAEIRDEELQEFPPEERTVSRVVRDCAQLLRDPGASLEEALRVKLADCHGDVRSCAVIAQLAEKHALNELAEDAYVLAFAGINDHSHHAERMMVALLAVRREAWAHVTHLTFGHVSMEVENRELSNLALAFANEVPVREPALEFFGALPIAIREEPFFLRCEANVHYHRGDLPQATRLAKKVWAAEPVAGNLLFFLAALSRSGCRADAEQLLRDLDIRKVQGSPKERMTLAHHLHQIGRYDDAVSIAYEALQQDFGSPELHLGFFGLLAQPASEPLIPAVECVGLDTWFEFEDEDDQKRSFTIENEPSRDDGAYIRPSHKYAAAAWSRRVGDSFSIQLNFGASRQFRIVRLTHKYLHALHDVRDNFETRFPGALGFQSFRMQENDVQPVLDVVKQLGERDKRQADFYKDRQLPLCMGAPKASGDPVGFAHYLLTLGYDVPASTGQINEREAARSMILAAYEKRAVLDTYTAWTAASLGVLEPLASLFDGLIVARSTIDDLRVMQGSPAHSEHAFTMSWINGEFHRTMLTEDEHRTRFEHIDALIREIEGVCSVEPVDAPAALDLKVAEIIEFFGGHICDAIFLAKHGRVLISDDLHYRKFAHALDVERSVWLQPCLEAAARKGLIEDEQYAIALAKLAELRHSYVSVTGGVLAKALFASDDDRYFRPLLRYIGGPSAEIRSHINVLIQFAEVSGFEIGERRRRAEAAFGQLLERLLADRVDDWQFALWMILHHAPKSMGSYVVKWAKGHFLDLNKLNDVHRTFAAESVGASIAQIFSAFPSDTGQLHRFMRRSA